MKSVLDLDELLANGDVTAEEYERFKSYSVEKTSSLALNLLLGLGVFAMTGGIFALLPSPEFALVLGFVMSAIGVGLSRKRQVEWGVLASSLLFGGSLVTAPAVFSLAGGEPRSFFVIAVFCGIVAIGARSVAMASIATLAFSVAVSVFAFYNEQAKVHFSLMQPAVTVAVFAPLAFAAWYSSGRVRPVHQSLLEAIGGTAELLVNLGFWFGSVFGDSLGEPRGFWPGDSEAVIKDWMFSLAWGAALLIYGVWGFRTKRRLVVNTVVIFGAIHFFTQHFKFWGFDSVSSLAAGLFAIAASWFFAAYNRYLPSA